MNNGLTLTNAGSMKGEQKIELHLSVIVNEKGFRKLQKEIFNWIAKNEDKIEDIYYNTNEVKEEKNARYGSEQKSKRSGKRASGNERTVDKNV